jgi:hypothetical protein
MVNRPERTPSLTPQDIRARALTERGTTEEAILDPIREGDPGADPSPSTLGDSSSMHSYHEWQLRRLQRRLRFVSWAMVGLGLVAAAALIYAVTGVRAQPDEVESSSAGATAQTEAVERLEEALFGGAEPTGQDRIGALARSLEALDSSGEATSARLKRLTRCLDRSLRSLDQDLRALLTRRITAERYVRQAPMKSCRSRL